MKKTSENKESSQNIFLIQMDTEKRSTANGKLLERKALNPP